MSKQSLTLVCGLLAAHVFGADNRSNAKTADGKPNVVVVMADDIGVGDLSFYHRQRTSQAPAVLTPNLDRLVAEGMRFSDAHSPASLCAPTRFAMLTGNYAFRNYVYGVWSPWAKSGVDPEFTTSARIAKAGGYRTSFFGKWGLGGGWKSRNSDFGMMDGGALQHGFDHACELPQGIQNEPYAFYENKKWMRLKPDSILKKIDAVQTGYSTSRKLNTRGGIGDSNWHPSQAGPTLATKAVAYIDRKTADQPGEPFFMYYCSQAVHIPHSPPKQLDGVTIAGSAPGVHGDMIRELDVQVGMIVNALKKAGAYDNTLFIFTSDNGGLTFDKGMSEAGHVTSNGRRGHKGSVHEGGHRVPFIAVWPGKIQPGSESHEPIVAHDVVATIAALADQPISRQQVKDSVNLLPLFTGKAGGDRHRYLMHQGGKAPWYALREGDWKLIIESNNGSENFKDITPTELYNLKTNPNEDEEQNLIKDREHQQRVQAMFAKYQRLRTDGESTVTSSSSRAEQDDSASGGK